MCPSIFKIIFQRMLIKQNADNIQLHNRMFCLDIIHRTTNRYISIVLFVHVVQLGMEKDFQPTQINSWKIKTVTLILVPVLYILHPMYGDISIPTKGREILHKFATN
uniref:Uncharacterized protein n=1 Tax=Micrurus spixii TaxID=129469 RepID=A0A2D4MT46_9SAUR